MHFLVLTLDSRSGMYRQQAEPFSIRPFATGATMTNNGQGDLE